MIRSTRAHRNILCSLLLLLASQNSHAASNGQDIRYPGIPEGQEFRDSYTVEILKKALANSGKNYRAVRTKSGIPHLRQVSMLTEGTIDVMWEANLKEREESLLPIKIPIEKGLLGWRILIINPEDQPLFSAVQTVDDLKKIPCGLVYSWGDAAILRANHFSIVETPDYLNTFDMLAVKRHRCFPRAISEIWEELDNVKDHHFVAEKSLLIHYPEAFYFYVNRKNEVLAADIEAGLKKMIATGEFDEIFNRHYAASIKRADITHRRVFDIENPLGSDIPGGNKPYWLTTHPTSANKPSPKE